MLLKYFNTGSWRRIFSDFNIPAQYESIGKLDSLLNEDTSSYKNIFIDEAHRFRNDDSQSHSKLMQLCRGKRVILITATPYNNKPNDILSLLRLFQNTKNSTIPNMPNLEEFFKKQDNKIAKYSRKKNYDKYIKAIKETSHKTRTEILKYLMVRRTRTELEKYFPDDIKKQNLTFPKVHKPVALFYQLNERENEIFKDSLEMITAKLKYARYKPSCIS